MLPSIKLITALALFSGALAIPAPNEDAHNLAKRGVNPVNLHVGGFMKVESPAKSDKIGGWGGLGWGYWTFAFDGAGYVKETFTYTLYKQEGSWNQSIVPPPQPVDKKFTCVIEAPTAVPANITGDVTLLSNEPWISMLGSSVKSASCTLVK